MYEAKERYYRDPQIHSQEDSIEKGNARKLLNNKKNVRKRNIRKILSQRENMKKRNIGEILTKKEDMKKTNIWTIPHEKGIFSFACVIGAYISAASDYLNMKNIFLLQNCIVW